MKLYHYTPQAGFDGIILNKTMRLTQSTQSNDKRDTVYIHDLINEKIEDFYINDDIKENRVIETILKVFNNFENERFIEGEGEKSEKAFVMCYTPKCDAKSLWKEYTDCNGYCLGINIDKFINYINNSETQKNIFKIANTYYMTGIIYNKENQKSLIKQVIKDEYDRFSSMPDDLLSTDIPTIVSPYQYVFKDANNNIVYKSKPKAFQIKIKQKFEFMAKNIIQNLLFISPLLKNDFWEEENETRLIFYRPVVNNILPNVQCDEVKGKNFIEFKIIPDIIEEIIIGPHNKKTIEEVKEQLLNIGYDISKIQIRYSNGKDVIR